MSSINTNLQALAGQQHQKKAQSSLTTSLERLSSGFRINSARDDAAGQAIANRMSSNINANHQLEQGISDGISLIQTAEGGLGSINDMVQRARELAVYAANGSLSDSDRTAINNEFHQLRAEIDRTASGTEIFGKYPLAPTTLPEPEQLGNIKSIRDIDPRIGQPQTSGKIPIGFIPAGVTNVTLRIDDYGANDDIQLFTRDGKHLAGTPVGSGGTWASNGISDGDDIKSQIFTIANGFDADAVFDDSHLVSNSGPFDPNTDETGHYNGMSIGFSGDGNSSSNYKEKVTISPVTEPVFILITGTGAFEIEELSWDEPPAAKPAPTSQTVDIALSANVGQGIGKVTIQPTPSDSESLGLMGVELDPWENAVKALPALDQALAKIDGYRGNYGTLTNRFEGAIANLNQQSLHTAAARSRIKDADYAVEVTNMTRAQILQQAGTSVLAQANQIPQGVLSLLG